MNTTLTIIAIILGPILAIQVQKIIERIKQRRDEKRKLFMSLMVTRGRPLLLEHVQALNMIDIVFSVKWYRSKKDKAVIDAWSVFRDHLYHFPKELLAKEGTDISKEDTSTYNAQMETWISKKDDLLIEILDKMAKPLGYRFDKVLLKRGSYTPRHYDDLEACQLINLRGIAQILVGNKSLPVNIVGIPPTEGKEAPQKAPPEEPKQEKASPEKPKQE